MRQFVLDEPYSRSAVWSRRIVFFSIALTLIGIVIVRFNAIEISAGIAVFGVAIVLTCVALLLAGAGAVVIWRTGRKGVGHVVTSILLGLIVLAFPAWLAVLSVRLPLINDISTDVNDPPIFSQSPLAMSAREGKKQRQTLAGALQQQRAYPDIHPIVIDLEAEDVFALVQGTVKSLGWRVIEQSAPVKNKPTIVKRRSRSKRGSKRGRRRTKIITVQIEPKEKYARGGRIEAIERSMIMGFPDDISVRIRPLGAQTRIDVRSASRYGRHDFGANAKRIRRFAAELQTQLDAR